MRTTKYVLFAALGLAAVVLLTSDTAKDIREDLEEQARLNAKKWKKKLGRIGNEATDTLADLREMLGSEIEGLSDDARERIENIVNGASSSAGKLKRNVGKQLA